MQFTLSLLLPSPSSEGPAAAMIRGAVSSRGKVFLSTRDVGDYLQVPNSFFFPEQVGQCMFEDILPPETHPRPPSEWVIEYQSLIHYLVTQLHTGALSDRPMLRERRLLHFLKKGVVRTRASGKGVTGGGRSRTVHLLEVDLAAEKEGGEKPMLLIVWIKLARHEVLGPPQWLLDYDRDHFINKPYT